MELTLDLYVCRNVDKNNDNSGFRDIMHETIDESDLLEFMQRKMEYESNIIVDSITVTNFKP